MAAIGRPRVGNHNFLQRALSCAALLTAVLTMNAIGIANETRQEVGTSVEPPGDSLSDARALVESGRYAEAEVLLRRLLKEQETETGAESLDVGDLLDVLVETLWRAGKERTPEAREFADRALKIKEAILGGEHPGYAASVTNLAILSSRLGDYPKAEALHQGALRIREQALGPEHPEVAVSLRNLGNVYRSMGRYDKSRECYERALAIQERSGAAADAGLATTLNGYGNLLFSVADYTGAAHAYERALLIWEGALGPDHPNVGAILTNLGTLYWETGDNLRSEQCYRRAVEVNTRRLGEAHPQVAASINNLGNIRFEVGDYPAALDLYERALHIWEESRGPDHPNTASAVGNVANTLAALGDIERAQATAERALSIWARTLGAEHREVAVGLGNVARIAARRGDLEKARSLYLESLRVREKALGPDHPLVAETLDELASVEGRMADAQAARAHAERAVRIQEARLDPEHSDLANSLAILARLTADAGDYDGARKHFERAAAMQDKSMGSDNPSLAETLTGLAALLQRMQQPQAALVAALQAEHIRRNNLRDVAEALSERQALRSNAAKGNPGLDIVLSLTVATDGPGKTLEMRRTTFDRVIRSRALIMDAMGARLRSAVASSDPEVERLLEALRAASRRVANLTVRLQGTVPAGALVESLRRARQDKEEAERALAHANAAFRREHVRRDIGLADVEGALPRDSALLSYVRFGHGPGRTPSYLAIVHRPGVSAPSFTLLGTAREIDALVEQWRREAAVEPRGSRADLLRAEARYRQVAGKLRLAVWDPIARHLEGAAMVFIVPDGSLHLMNVAALPVNEGRYLVEEDIIPHLLSAERDVVGAEPPAGSNRGFLVMGAPDFDADPGRPRPGVGGDERETRETKVPPGAGGPGQTPGADGACGAPSASRFTPLQGARNEIQEVANEWRRHLRREGVVRGEVQVLTGASASEGAFKRLAPVQRVVHLATHGFFLDGGCSPRTISSTTGPVRAPWWLEEPAPLDPDNPFLLAGLAFSGANRPHQAGVEDESEDGVLTAEEIAVLDLSRVEWLVLSACDTGTGPVHPGEGVLGLRRAFAAAGARTMLMSLFKVQDAAALEWMRHLYRARLSGMSTPASTRRASLAVIRARRASGLPPHPFFWGSFVAVGQWK